MLVPIASIAVLNRQRREINPKELQALADSIKESGLLHPPVIRRPFDSELSELSEEQSYVLCVGGRRLGAHILLGRTHLEVNLKEDLDPLSAAVAELSENLARSNITWQEEDDARVRIHQLRQSQNPFHTASATAKEIGVDVAQVTRAIKLTEARKLDPSLAKATSRGAALRQLEHKTEIKRRVNSIQSADRTVLEDKLKYADGAEFMKLLPSQSIDLVFSDLPYGIDYFEGAKSGEDMKGQYDDSFEAVKPFIEAVVAESVRVVKPSGWIVFFMCYEWHQWLQAELLKASGRSPEMPPWIWTRRGKGNHGHWPELHASNRYEVIVVLNGGAAKLTKKPVENVLDFPPFSDERLHAMQKPHELCQEIISRTTVIGEVVLDVCFGSGAHLAAAASLGRDFLGCDSNPDNLPKAIQLVAAHYHKISLVKP